MKEIQSFSQGQLIRQTGNIHPYGICLGLVTYWLIACEASHESILERCRNYHGTEAKNINVLSLHPYVNLADIVLRVAVIKGIQSLGNRAIYESPR